MNIIIDRAADYSDPAADCQRTVEAPDVSLVVVLTPLLLSVYFDWSYLCLRL
jgi:hypothetical protein